MGKIKMEVTYKVAFNEKQQNFHLDKKKYYENSHGWFTIIEYCTDLEFHIFDAYVNRIKKDRWTRAYLLKCAKEVKEFVINLSKHKVLIEQY